jgi:hypothetical protein
VKGVQILVRVDLFLNVWGTLAGEESDEESRSWTAGSVGRGVGTWVVRTLKIAIELILRLFD